MECNLIHAQRPLKRPKLFAFAQAPVKTDYANYILGSAHKPGWRIQWEKPLTYYTHYGCDWNSRDYGCHGFMTLKEHVRFNYTPLLQACAAGDFDEVKNLLDKDDSAADDVVLEDLDMAPGVHPNALFLSIFPMDGQVQNNLSQRADIVKYLSVKAPRLFCMCPRIDGIDKGETFLHKLVFELNACLSGRDADFVNHYRICRNELDPQTTNIPTDKQALWNQRIKPALAIISDSLREMPLFAKMITWKNARGNTFLCEAFRLVAPSPVIEWIVNDLLSPTTLSGVVGAVNGVHPNEFQLLQKVCSSGGNYPVAIFCAVAQSDQGALVSPVTDGVQCVDYVHRYLGETVLLDPILNGDNPAVQKVSRREVLRLVNLPRKKQQKIRRYFPDDVRGN